MDKEKLLAARKKLKEYQLNKKDNVQEQHNFSRKQSECLEEHIPLDNDEQYKNDGTERNPSQGKSTKIQFMESERNSPQGEITQIESVENERNPPQEKITSIQSVENLRNLSQERSMTVQYAENNIPPVNFFRNDNGLSEFINNSTPEFAPIKNIIDVTQNIENDVHFNTHDVVEKSILPLEEKQLNMDLKENNKIKSFEFDSLRDSSFTQKEHLLQMTSAVTEALVDANSSDETELSSALTDKNQFLTTCLQEQTKLVNQLHSQVSLQSSRVSELEAILTAKDAEFEAKLLQQINPLKEQLQLHTHTTGILVAEKAELTATLDQCRATINQKTELIEDLSGKLKSCQLHVIELEKEVASMKSSNEEINKAYQQLIQDHGKVSENFSDLRKEKEDLELESSEMKQKLSVKNTELLSLQQDLQEKNAMLSLNEMKIQQQIQVLENQHQTATVFEQQLTQLKEALKSVNTEKDEVSKQYQNYVQQLDERYMKVINDLDLSRKQIVEHELREKSYIQRLSEMEQQLQREREQIESLKPLLDSKDRIEILTRNIDNLVMEQESHQHAMTLKDAEIEALNKELQELRELKEQNLDATKLATALESEQLGASRAVSQNQQLKCQLNEMHDAFVLLSNSKLDLTEELQAERSSGKKLSLQLSQYESQLEDLRNQLKEKEATVIELQKEKLFNAQIVDKMQHYEARSHHAYTLQQELQNAQILTENLQKENKLLADKLRIQEQEKGAEKSTVIKEDDGQDSAIPISNGIEASKSTCAEQDTSLMADDHSPVNPEPLRKLESRFKETMEKVAELTDEKQRLEHLVLQLQGETETIGEYVTLYQRQRSILQEKAKEREETFRQIVEQRNQQQEQLHKLKVLVADLLKNKAHHQNVSPLIDNSSSPHVKTEESQRPENENNHHEITQENLVETGIDLKDETTSQIVDLLSEIKGCNNDCVLEPTFHPCLWCSGKLINV